MGLKLSATVRSPTWSELILRQSGAGAGHHIDIRQQPQPGRSIAAELVTT